MKQNKKIVWKAIKKAAEVEVDMKNTGWPPDCYGFLYQPKRPKKCKKVNIGGQEMKKKMMGLITILSVLMTPFSALHVCAAEELSTEQEMIYQEYKDDPEFNKMVEKYGEGYIKEFVEDTIEVRAIDKRRGGGGNICYQYVTNVMQINGYTCGPATVLQTLYGLGCASKVVGENDNQKIQTLADECGTNNIEGTLVGEVTDKIKKYSDRSYSYENCTNMSIASFEDKIAASLTNCKPVVLHAKTGYLDYYGGKNLGHYISLDYIDRTKDIVRLVDCNYDTDFYGIHEVTLEEAYNTVNAEENRYLIR